MGSHHQHHEFSGAKLRDAARHALEDNGEQWTPTRSAVYDALMRQTKPASAYDIADAVSQAKGKRVAPNSVYRILDLFVNNNLALRVESANAYIANAHPGCLHDCIFLVCDQCGKTTHLDDDTLTRHVRERADGEGFRVRRPIIEVLGLCAECG